MIPVLNTMRGNWIKMEIKVKKLTDESLVRRACEMTMRGAKSNISLDKIYDCEHSPIRCSIFWIELLDIPTFVSVHFVRHKIGIEHFVMSNRDDRGGKGIVTRESLVNHGMLVNAQALINMARKRLCFKAHKEVIRIFTELRNKIAEVDKDLAKYMVPECCYRRGCHELSSCGYWDRTQQPQLIK